MIRGRVKGAALSVGCALGFLALNACGTSTSRPIGASASSAGASNGEASKTGPQVAQDAAAALASAGAAHVTGTTSDPKFRKSLTLDLQIQEDGTSGSVPSGGFQVQIVVSNGATFIKAPAGFYVLHKASAPVAAKLAGRWVTGSFGAALAQPLELSAIAKVLSDLSASKDILPKVETGTLDGQEVVIVRASSGAALYVAATGKPYPLKLSPGIRDATYHGPITYSGFGQRKDLSPPAGAADVRQLLAG